MTKDYYAEIVENGYYIKDRNDAMFLIYQYEPFIPNRADIDDKDYRKYAQMQIDEMIKADEDAEKEKVTTESLAKDLETTKGAIDTLMQVVMMGSPAVASDEPTPALMAVDGINNTKEKGADNTMALYMATRIVDLEEQKEGAGKDYYRLYLSSKLWGVYKDEVDLLLADMGRADLIVDLTEAQ